MKHITALRIIALLAIIGVATLTVTPLWAGGRAVITLDALPAGVVAGEPLTIGFVVRQHGLTPLKGITPSIIARHAESGEKVTAPASPEGADGHYVATLTLPSGGVWQWVINDGFVTADAFGLPGGQPMPDLFVLGESPVIPSASTNFNVTGIISVASILGAAFGLLMLIRTRRLWAAGVLLASVIVAGLSFAMPGQAAPAASTPALSSDTSPEETGRALFLAKGCVMCHAHTEFNDVRQTFGDFRVGPDLSAAPNTAEYLRKWLSDPQSVKPTTEMPDLNLSEAEIEALVAFLKTNG